jgi:hypothetical protein
MWLNRFGGAVVDRDTGAWRGVAPDAFGGSNTYRIVKAPETSSALRPPFVARDAGPGMVEPSPFPAAGVLGCASD